LETPEKCHPSQAIFEFIQGNQAAWRFGHELTRSEDLYVRAMNAIIG
jgi:hypothetical protein